LVVLFSFRKKTTNHTVSCSQHSHRHDTRLICSQLMLLRVAYVLYIGSDLAWTQWNSHTYDKYSHNGPRDSGETVIVFHCHHLHKMYVIAFKNTWHVIEHLHLGFEDISISCL